MSDSRFQIGDDQSDICYLMSDFCQMKIIGIDLGSTSIKGGVLNTATAQIEHVARRSFPAPIGNLPRGHFEVEPQRVIAETDAVLDELLAHAPDARAVMLCSQMHGMILTDDQLNPLTNVLTWQDQRAHEPMPNTSTSYIESLMAQLTPAEKRALGHDVWAERPLAMLYWLAQRGELPQHAHFLSLPDFVNARWSGRVVGTDVTIAAASALYDVTRGMWAHDICRKFGLAQMQFPQIVSRTEPIGECVRNGRRLKIYAPIGDQQCALVGADLAAGELSLNVSTGAQVSMLSERAQFGSYQTRPFADERWLLTIIHLPAGRALNALVRLLTELATRDGVTLQNVWGNIERAASAISVNDLHIDLSVFSGALGQRGAITNMREDNLTLGHIFHAAFAQMAQNFLHAACAIDPSQSWQRVVLSGGLVRQSPTLMRLIEARFGCPIRVAEGGEDSLEGLLKLSTKLN